MENKIIYEKDYVTRFNLKTDTKFRSDLIDLCLNGEMKISDIKQCLAIGWSSVNVESGQYADFYNAVKLYVHSQHKKINPALNVFSSADVNDLFWTRDMNGVYWICRVKDIAKVYLNKTLDIGAILPVEAYAFGLEVPGQIKASFNRPNGGITEKIKNINIIEYSKFMFNKLSGKNYYALNLAIANNVIENLPDFELEELVISYLQIVKGYYLLSNSIANKSTTVKIECQLISRDLNNVKKAVVQVKGPKASELNPLDFKEFEDKNYYIYLYGPNNGELKEMKNVIWITPEEIEKFYREYKAILPESITQFENLFNIGFSEKQ